MAISQVTRSALGAALGNPTASNEILANLGVGSGVTPGVVAASSEIVVDANKTIDVLTITSGTVTTLASTTGTITTLGSTTGTITTLGSTTGTITTLGSTTATLTTANITTGDITTPKWAGAFVPTTLTFSPAAGGATVCLVTITVKDGAGSTIAAVHELDVWISDAATGAGLTAVTETLAAGASGAVVGILTAGKYLRVQTAATGVFILSITDAAKTGVYVCAAVPGTGKAVVSSILVTGNFG